MSPSNHSPFDDPRAADDGPLEELLAADRATADSSSNDTSSSAEELDAGEGSLVRLQAELKEAQMEVLRAQAEMENFRKRVRREADNERRFVQLPLITDLLGVLDNLQRAIEAAEQSSSANGLLEGVKMVARQIQSVLEKHHCRPIEAQGAAFDPHLHEAIAQQPTANVPPGMVVNVATVGYTLHDRVVRPAQVVVSVAVEGASPSGQAGPPDSPR